MTTRRAWERRADLNRRLMAAFVEGAEEDSRRRLGRGLTEDELDRVLRRYPGAAKARGEAFAPAGASRRRSHLDPGGCLPQSTHEGDSFPAAAAVIHPDPSEQPLVQPQHRRLAR